MKEFLEIARRIVEAEKALYPGCEDVVNFDFGGSSSSTDSKFQRYGTQANDISYQLPALLSTLINNSAGAANTSQTLPNTQSAFFQDLMTRTPSTLPGYTTWQNQMNMSPTSFQGSDNLASISTRDPYSTAFEESTQSAYEQRARDAMAQVATGPEAVRGGTARTGIAQGVMADRLAQGRGAEVRAAQVQDAGLSMDASKLFGALEGSRRGLQMQGAQGSTASALEQSGQGLQAAGGVDRTKLTNTGTLQMASDLLGTKKGNMTDNFAGKGSQTNDSFNWGVNLLGGCCFIFLESLNGKLPWFIERARHDYYTGYRRHGYKWMSNWLVPRMRAVRGVKQLVNHLVVKPFLHYGRWLYGDSAAKWWDSLYGPYCEAWLVGWSVLGVIFRNRKVD